MAAHTEMMTRIYFQPASQVDNVGDLLINLATMRALRPYGTVVVNDLRSPGWFIDAIGAGGDQRASQLFRHNFHVSLALRLIRQRLGREQVRDFLVLAPGHTARKGKREAAVAFIWYTKLLVLRVLGCTIVRAGFSIGPFDRLNAWVESYGTRAFSVYGVRDSQSLALARRHGFSRPSYFPDLAWAYRPEVAQGPPRPDRPIVLSFRSNAFGKVHDGAYLAPILDRLRSLLSAPLLSSRPIVVAFQVESDGPAARGIFDGLRRSGFPVELRTSVLSLDEAARVYADAWCVISNRLHVLLLALQSGTLPIALADSKDNIKITSILNDNNLEELVVSLNQGVTSSVTRLRSILGMRAAILARLADVRDRNAQRVEEGFERVFNPRGSHDVDRRAGPAENRTAGEWR
jgi:polysaccharide pyruvyl transferase WcaK-like protein